MEERILWIVPKWPIPPDDGARLASFNLIRGLSQSGVAIDLLAVATALEGVREDDAYQQLGVHSVSVVQRSGQRAGLMRVAQLAASALMGGRVPATMESYAAPAVSARLSECIRAGRWRYLVYDGLHPAIHAAPRGEYSKPGSVQHVIYRAHNREADIWSRMAEQSRSPLRKRLLNSQARKVRHVEDSVVRRSSAVATVSEEDAAAFRLSVPQARTVVVPIGYEFGEAKRIEPGSTGLLFLGRLDWFPNRDGLRWFLTRVWPKVAKRRSDLNLIIAGSGSPGSLGPMLSGPRIEFLGRVRDLAELYSRSALCLVPVFYGSGTRVKVIEASRFARPCLSTALGVEGVGLQEGESYFRAETEGEWLEALCSYDTRRGSDVGQQAYGRARQRFELQQCAGTFAQLLKGL